MNKRYIKNHSVNTEHKAQQLLMISLLISCMIMFGQYLFGNSLMTFNDIGSDTWQQYVQQYATIIRHLQEGNLTFWDFNNGLGTNMLSLNLFDPSLMLIYLLGTIFGISKIAFFLAWVHVLRVMAAGYVFYRFLSMFSFQVPIKGAISFAYALSGFLMVWGQHYQFGMVTVYFPLLLLFCEKYLRRERKYMFFPVMVALSSIYSVYQTYMALAAVGIYMIFRLWMLDGMTVSQRILSFIKGCMLMILGILMGAVIFVPSAYLLLNVTGRIGGSEQGIFSKLLQYMRLYPREYYESSIMRLFSSNMQESGILDDGRYQYFQNYYEDPVLYVSNTVLVLVTQMVMVFWRSKEKLRVKLAVYTATLLIGFMLLLQAGGFVMNAFVYPSQRYLFTLVPFLMLAAAWMWEYLLKTGKRSILGLLILFYAAERVFHFGYAQSQYAVHKNNVLVLAATCGVSMLLVCVYPLFQKIHMEKAAVVLMTVLMAVNAVSEGRTSYANRIVVYKEDSEEQTIFGEMFNSDVEEALAYLRENDHEFYRVEKDYSAGTLSMDAPAQGYYGVSTYNSTMNKYMKDFIKTCYPELFLYDENHVAFWPVAEDHEMASYMGVRYLLSKNPDLDADKYTLLKQFGEIFVYENIIETDMARFYETTISADSLRMLCKEEKGHNVLGSAIALGEGTHVENMKEFEKLAGQTEEVDVSIALEYPEDHAYIRGNIQAEKDGYVMFMIPYEDGWSLELDGKETEILCGDLGFISCEMPEGEHQIELRFRTPGLGAGAGISILAWGIYGVLLMFEKKRVQKQYKK